MVHELSHERRAGGVRRVVWVVPGQRRVGNQQHRPTVERVPRVQDASGRAQLDERRLQAAPPRVGERRNPIEHPPEVRGQGWRDVARRGHRRGGCVRRAYAKSTAGADRDCADAQAAEEASAAVAAGVVDVVVLAHGKLLSGRRSILRLLHTTRRARVRIPVRRRIDASRVMPVTVDCGSGPPAPG